MLQKMGHRFVTSGESQASRDHERAEKSAPPRARLGQLFVPADPRCLPVPRGMLFVLPWTLTHWQRILVTPYF
jgi:hypothetical protein